MYIIDKENKQEQFYWFTKEQKIDQKFKGELKNYFGGYLKKLQENNIDKDKICIEKINHLRDAITANMVGIISHS